VVVEIEIEVILVEVFVSGLQDAEVVLNILWL